MPPSTTVKEPTEAASKAEELKSLAVTIGVTSSSRNRSSASESEASGVESIADASKPVERYYLWGCELSRSSDVHTFEFPADVDPESARHLIVLKMATLGVDAKEKERNVVEIHFADRDGKEQRLQILTLMLGLQDSCQLDIPFTWTPDKTVSLKLVKGSGPVTVAGNHVVEGEMDTDFDYVPPAASADDTGDVTMDSEDDKTDAEEVGDLLKDAKENGIEPVDGKKSDK